MTDDHRQNAAHRETINVDEIVEKENVPRLKPKLTMTRVGFYLAKITSLTQK